MLQDAKRLDEEPRDLVEGGADGVEGPGAQATRLI
jgi:hypothetical protein